MHRFTILISGGGGLARRVIAASREAGSTFMVDRVIASRADCPGLAHASAASIAMAVVRPRNVWAAVNERTDTVLLLGWLHLIDIPQRWTGRVINVHPSLLPRFGGKGMHGHHVHEAILRAGERETGFTFHLATDEYDAGPILHQERVPVLPDDTTDTLQSRVIDAQHRAIIPFLQRWVATTARAAA
jgi:phosphoribosylglycinamide formyltransferase-1